MSGEKEFGDKCVRGPSARSRSLTELKIGRILTVLLAVGIPSLAASGCQGADSQGLRIDRGPGGANSMGGDSSTGGQLSGSEQGASGGSSSTPHGTGGTDSKNGSGGGAAVPGMTLSDYRPCEFDSDCPVGLGDCLTEVPLNIPDSTGRASVPLEEIFGELGSTGICSRSCTNSASACDGLALKDGNQQSVVFSCQLVVEGDSPYQWTNVPLPESVDEEPLVMGVPFGAICRPPFELDASVPNQFCAPCKNDSQCEGGICFDFQARVPGTEGTSGTCAAPCESEADCPTGFHCSELEGIGQVCEPVAGTCGACRDGDNDGAGVGQCAAGVELSTPVDCNDKDASIYFDAKDRNHAFPDICADVDRNCNGVSDAEEILAQPELFGDQHCGTCNTPCSGAVEHGEAQCLARQLEECPTEGPCEATTFCGAKCDDGWADCNPDVAGCETSTNVGDGASQEDYFFYPDLDRDGYGDGGPHVVPLFACDGVAPPNTVNNNDDCNDNPMTGVGIHPGAQERCDEIDWNCDGEIHANPVDGIPYYEDSDDDGAGDPNSSIVACARPVGYVANSLDCNPTAGNETYFVYWADSDGDGYGNPMIEELGCSAPSGFTDSLNGADCDDTEGSIHPGAVEQCDDIDHNCIGGTTDGLNFRNYYVDKDQDGFGDHNATGKPEQSRYACAQPDGFVPNRNDCDDREHEINPDAKEVCDDIDHNCVGGPLDGITQPTWYRDGDNDGHGDENDIGSTQCQAPGASYVANDKTDCDDSTHEIGPHRLDVCDGIDNDCSEGGGNVNYDSSCYNRSVRYLVFPETDTRSDAQSVSDIRFTFYGTNPDRPWEATRSGGGIYRSTLHNGEQKFFEFTTTWLGVINNLKVENTSTDGWYGKRVVVVEASTGIAYQFGTTGWVDTQDTASRTLSNPQRVTGYVLTAVTATASSAASDDNHYVSIGATSGPGGSATIYRPAGTIQRFIDSRIERGSQVSVVNFTEGGNDGWLLSHGTVNDLTNKTTLEYSNAASVFLQGDGVRSITAALGTTWRLSIP